MFVAQFLKLIPEFCGIIIIFKKVIFFVGGLDLEVAKIKISAFCRGASRQKDAFYHAPKQKVMFRFAKFDYLGLFHFFPKFIKYECS